MRNVLYLQTILLVSPAIVACGLQIAPEQNGQSTCGTFGGSAVICNAGQYCADADSNRCVEGCLNDTNCSPDQTCVIEPDQSIGACSSTPSQAGQETCGNGACDNLEDHVTCPADCQSPADACQTVCDDYSFFSCFSDEDLESCYARCQQATIDQATSFYECADSVTCNTAECLGLLPDAS